MSAKDTAVTALDAAEALRELLDSEGSAWPVQRVERQVMDVRADLQAAIDAVRSEHGVDGHDAIADLLTVALAMQDLVVALNAGRSRVVSWEMPVAGNLALAAWLRYGDVSRRAELLALNDLRDPHRLQPGQILKVLAG